MANEKRLIDANAIRTFISGYVDEPDYQHTGEDWRSGAWAVAYEISIAPTVDAVEVVHSKWGYRNGPLCCLNCGFEPPYSLYSRDGFSNANYCPNCGASMKN